MTKDDQNEPPLSRPRDPDSRAGEHGRNRPVLCNRDLGSGYRHGYRRLRDLQGCRHGGRAAGPLSRQVHVDHLMTRWKRSAEADAWEIRKRAEDRLGALSAALDKAYVEGYKVRLPAAGK